MTTGDVVVSVLMPLRDEERHVESTLAAVLAQDLAEPFEVLLVEGRSVDRTRALLDAHAARDPRLRVIDNPRRTVPAALNAGLAEARGEFVVRMDAHTRYPPHYLRRVVERLRAGDAAHVSGPAIAVGSGRWGRRIALALNTWLGTGGAAFRAPGAQEREIASGFTGGWRRAALERLGGWDERWPVNEDAELAARLGAAGGRSVLVPQLAAAYAPRESLRALVRQYLRYGLYRARTDRRHPRTLRPVRLLPPAVALTTLCALVVPPLRTVARVPLAAYATLLVAVSARQVRSAGARDAGALPVVLAAMHLAWGTGYLAGLARWSLPAPERRPGRRPRVALVVDDVFHAEPGAVRAEQAFTLFATGLADELGRLVLVGRVRHDHLAHGHRLRDDVDLVGLPDYERATELRTALPAMAGALARFWRALGGVDGVWLDLGPSPLPFAFAALARLRGRWVVISLRQDLPRYVRSRQPGRRGLHLVADALDLGHRALARRAATIVVGPALRRRFAHAPRLLEVLVSLVRERDVADGPAAGRRDDDGVLRLLSVGRLSPEKNPLLLADVLAHLRRADPRWRLVVCGDGPLAPALRGRLDALGLAEHAELRGYVPVERGLAELYRTTDVLLHVAWTEGVPQVLLEAFGNGLPVVATAVGGVADVARGAALLVAPGDADAAARAVLRLTEDAEERTSAITAGLRRAREHTLERECARIAGFLVREDSSA